MRRAFTLVELLVAIGVMAVLAGMVTAALVSVNADARRARCETQMVAMNAMLQSRLETYLTLRIDGGGIIEQTPATSSIPPWVQLGSDSARLRMINLREQLRLELPDRKADLMFPAQVGTAVPNLSPTQAAIYHFDQFGRPMPAPNAGSVVYQRPAPTTLMAYRRAVAQLTGQPFGPSWHAAWTPQYEGSECLYLILASTVVAGRSGLEVVRRDQIGDLDGDGVPEILDPWGTPMVWMRWPVGYWMTYGQRAQWGGMTSAERLAYILETKETLGYDQYDPLRVDWRNIDTSTAANAPEKQNDTFNVPPVIVSAGPDREFDLMLRSSDSSSTDWLYGDPLIYGNMTWSVSKPPFSATYPYYYPDPFPRNYYGSTDPSYTVDYIGDANPFAQGKNGGWVGAYFDADGDQVDDSADNIYSVSPL